MTDRPLSVVPAYLVRSDLMLLVAALVGLAAFLWLMPGQHPSAVGDARLGEAAAVEASEAFLEEHGYATDGLGREVSYEREDELVMAAQRRLGRRAAVEHLREARHVPAYHWRVRWQQDEEEPDQATGYVFTTYHTNDGALWAFEPEVDASSDGTERAVTAVDHAALAVLTDDGEALEAAPDSALQAGLSFTTDDRSWATPLIRDEPGAALTEWLQEEAPREPLTLTATDAAAMARHHLEGSALQEMGLEADSVWLVYDEGRPLPARTRFTGEVAQIGLSVEATVDVLPAGRLHGIQVEFGSAGEESTLIADVSSADIYNGITLVAYLVLIIAFIVVFVRRLSARLIDAQAALRDAVVGGILALSGAAFGILPVIWQETPNVGLALFASGTTISMMGLAGAGAIFVIACAADAIARESWPAKLETLTRFRRGALRTVPAGLALVRGVMLGGVLLGLVALVLWIFPGVAIDVTQQDEGLFPLFPAPFLVWTASYGWYALFLSLAVLLGVGTYLYGYRPSGPLVVVGIAVVFALLQVGPVSLEPAPAIGLLSLAVGMAVGWAFWRYSILTGAVGILLMYLGWQVLPGWLVAGSPIASAPVLLVVLVAGLLVVGTVGIASGQVGSDVSQYVPDYIREMTQQQRLERELEIAREVQQSFLPRRMPEVEGVDVAAMCLPANEVGGDYYDFVALGPGELGVVIGDVSGKGIQAAFYMTLAKGFLQTLARSGRAPAEVLRRLNRLFYENATRGTFISMIYGVLDVEKGTFTFARAGHTPLVKYCAEEEKTELVRPGGVGIGLTRGGFFDQTIREQTLELTPGDALVFYTDGFTEAMNRRKEQYGDSKLVRVLSGIGDAAASDILRRITDDVNRFIDGEGRHDDMTMVVLKLAPVDERARAAKHKATHITLTP